MNLLLIVSPYVHGPMRLTQIVDRKIAGIAECVPDPKNTLDEFLWYIEDFRLNGFGEPDNSFDPVI